MAYVFFNPNPKKQLVGDCAVRAICKALGRNWDDAYIGLCSEGLYYHDMPNSNYVWGMYLSRFGFEQMLVSSICPKCTTVKEFADDHPEGRYVLACQNHVVTVCNGNYYDSWDSGHEIVLYYWQREA